MRLDTRLLLSTAAIALLAAPAYANPAGGSVTTGSASISTSANKTSVNQSSEDVVINWSSFNIGNGQTTQFAQPNAQAIAVNRIGGASASQILGTLDANGRIVLINGNGMLFGKGSQVNVGSLIATSTDGSDSDLLSGKFTQAGNQNAKVVNQGQIVVGTNGVVALVAPNVTNTGTVNAKLGTVALGAANKFTVDFTGDGLVSFASQGDVNARASAINSGLLSGANVSMTAHAANGIATGVVNMSGVILAQGVQNIGGTIYLDAGNGTLTTTGTLNAAGATGGGHIETSGQAAFISGHITAGQGGQWKVDPEDLTIDSAAATTIDGALNGGTSVLEQTTSGPASGTGNQTSGEGDINVESALSWSSMATLTLDSYHSINIDAPITITGAGGLVLQYNDSATDGALSFGLSSSGFTGNVDFADSISNVVQGSLTINGNAYELVNNPGSLETDIVDNPSAYVAFASFYNGSGDSISGSDLISTTFTGIFEGLGNTISSERINDASETNVGLFADIGVGGIVRDLALSNFTVTSSTASANVGILAGANSGTIANVAVAGSVTNIQDSATIGGLAGTSDGTISGSSAAVTVQADNNALVGGLAGENIGSILSSSSSSNVTAGSNSQIGGLVGENADSISYSYATGTIVGADSGSEGGLVGSNVGSITYSYATGNLGNAIDTENANVGGLVGINEGTLQYSYATGSVVGGGGNFEGGLIGFNDGGPVSYAYSYGAVTGGQNATLGGLIGDNIGTVDQTYSTGAVLDSQSGAKIGGLIGEDDAVSGNVTNSYWDTSTSGVTSLSQGAGNVANDSGITGEPTTTLQGALPAGFDNTVWGTGAGLYPYFLWQYPSGTPQAITGTSYTDAGVTVDAGDTITALLDGNSIGSASSGANGYYYFLLAPGSLAGTDAVYVQSGTGATVADDLGASRSGVDIWGNYFRDLTAESYLSNAGNNIEYAIGNNAAAETFATNLINQDIVSSAATFSVDDVLDGSGDTTVRTTNGDLYVTAEQDWATSGTLTLDSFGSIYMRQPIEIDSGANLAFITSDGGSGALVFQGGNAFFTAPADSALAINGQAYTLVPDIATLASDVAAAPTGFYALADSYDASTDGTYAQAAVPTTLTGTFEGLGNTISNLTINDPGGDSVGLFAAIGSTGTVRDIGLLDVSVTGGNGGSDGALAGVNQGTIFGAFANGSVTGGFGTETGGLIGNNSGGTILESFANDAVQGQSGSNLGGFVGENTGNISQSYASGAVTSGNTTAVGGFVGYNQGAISASYSTGAVSAQGSSTATLVGGFAGENDTGGTVDESYTTGAVSPGSATTFGAFAGTNNGMIGGTVHDYYDTSVNSGMAAVGGGSAATGLSGLTAAQFLSSAKFTGWTFGTPGSGADWVIVDNNGTLNNGAAASGGTLPFLTMEYSTAISNENQLQLMALDLTESYVLIGNVTYDGAMWSTKGFVPVGNSVTPFEGTFDGQLYTISNLTIDRPTQNYVGLFGDACGCTEIGDVTLDGGSVTGSDDVGALVGASYGAILGVESSVDVTGSYNASSPTTGFHVGGLVGYYDGGGFFESSSSGTVSGYEDVGGLIGQADYSALIQDVQASGHVEGGVSVGGLIGSNDGIVLDAVATGNVVANEQYAGGLVGLNFNDGELLDSSASGDVGGKSEAGGFVGINQGYIDQSFATGFAFGNFQVGGFVGDNAKGSLIQDSYAMGFALVAGNEGSDGTVGGFAGENAGEIDHAYSTGGVVCIANDGCTGTIGGFIGQNDGIVDANSFWDTETSGVPSTNGIGTDNTGDGANVIGKTTAALQSALDSTWDPTVWGIVPGVSYPYLLWQTGGGTPQVISGTALAANGSTTLGLNAGLLVDGSSVTPLADMASGANGYYYMLLAPDTIDRAQVLVYLTNGPTAADTYVQNDSKSIAGLILREGQLRVRSAATDTAAIFAGLDTALGSASGADFLYSAGSGFTPGANLVIADSAADFTIDSSIDLGSGQLTLVTAGSDMQTDGIITASWLRGDSDGGASFDDANEIGNLGVFTNSGSGGFALTDAETLKINGAVGAGTGDLTLTTTGTGSNIAVNRAITAGGTVTLTSAGTIAENASFGGISATTLTGSASGAAVLNGANEIGTLDGFTTTGGVFRLTDDQTLTVDGAVNAGSNVLALLVISGDLDIDDTLDGKSVILGSTTGEVEGAGAITASFLSVSADTGIDLTGNNDIGKIGPHHTNSGPDTINNP